MTVPLPFPSVEASSDHVEQDAQVHQLRQLQDRLHLHPCREEEKSTKGVNKAIISMPK